MLKLIRRVQIKACHCQIPVVYLKIILIDLKMQGLDDREFVNEARRLRGNNVAVIIIIG